MGRASCKNYCSAMHYLVQRAFGGMLTELMSSVRGPVSQGGNGGARKLCYTYPAMKYWLGRNGKQQGPFTLEDLRRMALEGKVSPNDWVGREGDPGWVPFGEVAAAWLGSAIPSQGSTQQHRGYHPRIETMFGFGKTAIDINKLADFLADAAIQPINKPMEQDILFQNQAVEIGMNKTRFLLEAAALQYFAVAASINTIKLLGKIKDEQAYSLMKAMITSHLHKFHNELNESIRMELLLIGLGTEDAFNLIDGRSVEYGLPENFVSANEAIPRLFARFCGVPDPNDILQRIGWSIFFIRGGNFVEILKRVKIV